MKRELINNIANQGIYQLDYYENKYLIHKKIKKMLLILISTLIICLIVLLDYYYLKF